MQCKFCGKQHVSDKKQCPAWGKSCKNCGNKNQFVACCKTKKEVYTNYDESEEDENVAVVANKHWVHAVTTERSTNKLFPALIINGKKRDSNWTVEQMLT